MDRLAVSDPPRELPPLPLRAWNAWRRRGGRYAIHKGMRRALGRWPGLKRRLVYADPRAYWTLRGGDEYFLEQEGQPGRSARSEWLADRIASYHPATILEIGCGYGKQLRAIRTRIDAAVTGLDFSPSQLAKGRDYLREIDRVHLVLGSGTTLPFPDRSFDLVLTSAVILHNAPEAAERIRREVVRVSRRWTAHNEDTDVTYNRYGYDTAAWYRANGFTVVESGPIPTDPNPSITQFCLAEPWRA